MPILFSSSLNLAFELPKVVFFRICLMLMLAIFVLKIVKTPKLEIFSVFLRKDVKILITGFLIFVGLGIIASSAPVLSFWGSYYRMMGGFMYFNIFLFFLLLVLNFHSKEQWEKAIKVFILSVFVVSLYGTLQLLGLDLSGLGVLQTSLGRVSSTFGHPSYLAGYIDLVIFLLLSYAIIKRKWWIWLAFLMGIVSLVFSGTRGAFVGLFCGLGVFGLLYGLAFDKKRILAWTIAIPVTLLILVFSANYFGVSRFDLKENFGTVEIRMMLWKGALNLASERPLLGHGFETFGIEFQRYFDPKLLHLESVTSIPDRAHNIVIDTMVTNGLLGLCVLFYGLFVIFTVGWSALKNCNQDDKYYVIGILSGISAVFVASMFGFMVPELAMVLAFMLAFLAFLSSQKTIKRNLEFMQNIIIRRIFAVVLLLFVAFSIFFQNILVIAADYKLANSNTISDTFDAVLYNPYQSYYLYVLSAELRDAGELELADFYSDKANYINGGRDGLYYMMKGKIEIEKCRNRDKKACKEGDVFFGKAFEKMPYYPPVSLNWGILSLERGDCVTAMEKFNYYLDIMPGFWKNYGTVEYERFYLHNPNFDRVFDYMDQC